MSDEEFPSGDAGASNTYPMQCSALSIDGYVMLKGRPCKIVEMSISRTGKHGHAKVHLVALDIFTQKELEEICTSTQTMDVPIVKRKEYTFLDIKDGYLSLLGDAGDTREDLEMPEGDLGKQILDRVDKGEESFIVTVLKAMGEEAVIDVKTQTS